MGKRELVALLSLSSWCLVIVVWLFLAVPWVSLQFVFVVFPDHTHLLFFLCSVQIVSKNVYIYYTLLLLLLLIDERKSEKILLTQLSIRACIILTSNDLGGLYN